MNEIFDIAVQNKAKRDSKKRGSQASLKSTISIPFFKGVYRKKGNVTGTFVMSYFTCIAYCLVKHENADRTEKNKSIKKKDDKLAPVTLDTFLIEALISSEGFALDTYSQGKVQGAKRIEGHLNAIELAVSVKDDVVVGLTDKIVDAVLTAI